MSLLEHLKQNKKQRKLSCLKWKEIGNLFLHNVYEVTTTWLYVVHFNLDLQT